MNGLPNVVMPPIGTTLPTDSAARKEIPMVRGLLDYFPAALAAVAQVSKAGNDKHNPGEEMHHARGKSSDHADCIVRHLLERGTTDSDDGQRHSAKMAWRALALLQEELEAVGAPLARGATVTPVHVHACVNVGHASAVQRRKNDGEIELYAPDCKCICGVTYSESPEGWGIE
jgi:hypothetical protein